MAPVPELPEVEVTRKLCERHLVGRSLTQVQLAADPIVFAGQSPRALRSQLEGQRVTACQRHGKYFWWELSEGALLLHLGMAGSIQVPEGASLRLSHGIEFAQESWPPRFAKLWVETDAGQRLAFCDARRFGRVKWQSSPRSQAPVLNLGLDPLHHTLTCRDVASALHRRRGTIKGLLLNQKVFAGIGNWIADEVLYQAGIDPRSCAGQLSKPQISALHRAILQVVERAVAVDADATRFPPHWLFHHRWGKHAKEHPRTGAKIEFITVAGRTTAWVPSRQTSVSPQPPSTGHPL